jgi:hypothetical protein
MKKELGKCLRDQMSLKETRHRTESSSRQVEGLHAQTEWTLFNQRKDLEAKARKAEVRETLLAAYNETRNSKRNNIM